MAQRHLRQVLGNLGASVMGGEAHVAYKPRLIDRADVIADAGARWFLQSFIDRSSIGLQGSPAASPTPMWLPPKTLIP